MILDSWFLIFDPFLLILPIKKEIFLLNCRFRPLCQCCLLGGCRVVIEVLVSIHDKTDAHGDCDDESEDYVRRCLLLDSSLLRARLISLTCVVVVVALFEKRKAMNYLLDNAFWVSEQLLLLSRPSQFQTITTIESRWTTHTGVNWTTTWVAVYIELRIESRIHHEVLNTHGDDVFRCNGHT